MEGYPMNKSCFSILVGIILLFMFSEATVSTCLADLIGPDGVYHGPSVRPEDVAPPPDPDPDSKDANPDHSPNGTRQSNYPESRKKHGCTPLGMAEWSVFLIALGSVYGLHRVRSKTNDSPINKEESHD